MNLLLKFSQLEFNPDLLPPTEYINLYGFATDIVFEKLSNVSSETIASDYLKNMVKQIENLENGINNYSQETFKQSRSTESIEMHKDEMDILYVDFLKNIDLNTIDDTLLRAIMNDVVNNHHGVSCLLLKYEFRDFKEWLKNIISRKFSNNNFEENETDYESDISQNEKIVWLKGKEDFIALIGILLQNNFILNRRSIYKHIANHFSWADGEMVIDNLRISRNKIMNESTHNISDDLMNTLKILIEKKEL